MSKQDVLYSLKVGDLVWVGDLDETTEIKRVTRCGLKYIYLDLDPVPFRRHSGRQVHNLKRIITGRVSEQEKRDWDEAEESIFKQIDTMRMERAKVAENLRTRFMDAIGDLGGLEMFVEAHALGSITLSFRGRMDELMDLQKRLARNDIGQLAELAIDLDEARLGEDEFGWFWEYCGKKVCGFPTREEAGQDLGDHLVAVKQN